MAKLSSVPAKVVLAAQEELEKHPEFKQGFQGLVARSRDRSEIPITGGDLAASRLGAPVMPKDVADRFYRMLQRLGVGRIEMEADKAVFQMDVSCTEFGHYVLGKYPKQLKELIESGGFLSSSPPPRGRRLDKIIERGKSPDTQPVANPTRTSGEHERPKSSGSSGKDDHLAPLVKVFLREANVRKLRPLLPPPAQEALMEIVFLLSEDS